MTRTMATAVRIARLARENTPEGATAAQALRAHVARYGLDAAEVATAVDDVGAPPDPDPAVTGPAPEATEPPPETLATRLARVQAQVHCFLGGMYTKVARSGVGSGSRCVSSTRSIASVASASRAARASSSRSAPGTSGTMIRSIGI